MSLRTVYRLCAAAARKICSAALRPQKSSSAIHTEELLVIVRSRYAAAASERLQCGMDIADHIERAVAKHDAVLPGMLERKADAV